MDSKGALCSLEKESNKPPNLVCLGLIKTDVCRIQKTSKTQYSQQNHLPSCVPSSLVPYEYGSTHQTLLHRWICCVLAPFFLISRPYCKSQVKEQF